MGPEDKNGEMVVYCDGQPVGAAWDAIVVTVKAAATALTKLWDTIVVQVIAAAEFRKAMRWAEAYNRPLAYRYHNTKKKRIRKKYAKRILAWYRTEVIGVGE